MRVSGDWMKHAFLALMVLAPALPLPAQAVPGISLPDTLGSFEFRDHRGDTSRPIKVWYYRPANAPAKRVVFLLHGSSRTGQQAQQLGAAYARKHNVILVAPEFSQQHYPDLSYDFGSVMDENQRLRPDSLWALNIIEHLFDAVVAQAKVEDRQSYDLVGHSAGGQFINRMVLLMPAARYRRAVISSPGRYLMADNAVSYPYGLGGTRVDSASLARSFARDVVVILGDRDVADQARQWEPETMLQGKNRFARGLRFVAASVEQAFRLATPLSWRLHIVHGVDHDPPTMVRAALEALAP